MNREQFDDYIRQEFSEGTPIEPLPEPPLPIQYPPTPRQWEPVKQNLQQNLGLIVGSMLIGVSLGLWLSEFEWVKG